MDCKASIASSEPPALWATSHLTAEQRGAFMARGNSGKIVAQTWNAVVVFAKRIVKG